VDKRNRVLERVESQCWLQGRARQSQRCELRGTKVVGKRTSATGSARICEGVVRIFSESVAADGQGAGERTEDKTVISEEGAEASS
jgi:hypothetical protein